MRTTDAARATATPRPLCAEVAVPLPLRHPLTYSLSAKHEAAAQIGSRVRVRVGQRRLTGIILEIKSERPPGLRLRPVDQILDRDPVLPRELLDLATFVAEYYLAPIGETLRAMIPRALPSWGALKVRLTQRGTFLATTDDSDRSIIDALLARGPLPLVELQGLVTLDGFPERLASLESRGLVSIERPRAAGSRYRTAVELKDGRLEEHLVACGRSPRGREVVEYLAALGRPATIRELTSAIGCGPTVIRRLVEKGLLRSFTQMERLSLDRHLVLSGSDATFELNADQTQAVENLGRALSERRFASFLLQGVTGSGKTEVYLRAVEETLRRDRSALLLVPEISLVPALAAATRRRFGDQSAILHSGLGDAERAQEWERARLGTARVVLGPRSAIFAPVRDLGLVVVDEEQDSSFKQETTPRYHARDLAVVRARDAGAVVVLVSATPSLESRHNVAVGKAASLTLHSRVGGGRLPEGILVDLRAEKAATRRPREIHLSQRLLAEMESGLERGEQIILLRNRRGYAPILLCRACGENLPCNDCGLPRTLHRRENRLICHYCGSTRPVPQACPTCGDEALEPIGAGTERVEEEIRDLFPQAKVDILDRDASRRIGGAAAVLERFSRSETDILVGTQMVSKGHHFPNVGLTAVLSADSYLGFPDFRAVERTYSLLTQLAGRAGRGTVPGKVIIQTYHPEHYAIRAALANDDEGFVAEEMRFRRIFHYPPYGRMIQLVFRGKNRDTAEGHIERYARALYRHPLAREVRVSGPAPAPLEKLKGYWRFQILLRCPSSRLLRRLVLDTLPEEPSPGIVVDVDPQDLF